MTSLSEEARGNLAFVRRECEKIESRIAAWEEDRFDAAFESMNPIGAQAAVEGLRDEACAAVARGLRECDEVLDALAERLGEVEGALGERSRLMSQEREQLARDYNEKRKSVNAGNVAKGFWSVYAGLFLCVIVALMARDAGFGLPGSVIGGVLGYATGFCIMRYFSAFMAKKKKADPEAHAAAEKELEDIKARYDEMGERLHEIQDRLLDVGKLDDPISELQDLVQDALEDYEDCEYCEEEPAS